MDMPRPLPSPPPSLCSSHFLPLLVLKLEKIITLQRVASLSSRFKSTFGPASICHTFCGPNEPLPAPALQLFLCLSLSLPVSLSFVSPASTAAVPNQPKPKLKLKQRHHPKELKVRAHWQLRPSAQKIYTPIPIYIYVYTIYSKITDSKRQRAKCIKYPKRRETKATKSKAEVERVLHKFTFHVCSVAVERSCSRQNLTATWRLHFYISI